MAQTRMCPNCRAFIDIRERVCPYCEVELRPARRERPNPSGRALGGLVPETHATTFIILFLNFAIFAAMLILSQKLGSRDMFGVDIRVLDAFGAKERYGILALGQWWRLVTAGFLHGGVFHILMNSWVLYDLGAQVEQIFGTARFLVIYLVSSVAGFWVSLYFSPALSSGASAALCGLIGAMMAYGRRTHQSFIWSMYLRWIIFIAIIGLIIPFVDNAAHFGGFGAGFMVGWLAASPPLSQQLEWLWRAAATFVTAIAVLSLVLAYLSLSRALSGS